jgi:hypothetical protein
MDQYLTYTTGVLIEYTDGVDTFRDGSLGGSYVIEHLDGASWDDIEMLDSEGITGIPTFRDGIRDSCYVIDKALTVTGFLGSESLDEGVTGDWINLEKLEIE